MTEPNWFPGTEGTHFAGKPLPWRQIEKMAAAARPTSDSDYGSERQIEAQNAFFELVWGMLTPQQFEYLEEYCLKACPDEMIDEALRLLATGDVGRDGR